MSSPQQAQKDRRRNQGTKLNMVVLGGGAAQKQHLLPPQLLQQQLETIASHHSQESPNLAAKEEIASLNQNQQKPNVMEEQNYLSRSTEQNHSQIPQVRGYNSCQDLRKLETNLTNRNSQMSLQSSSFTQKQLLSFQSAYLQDFHQTEGFQESDLSNPALLSQYLSMQQQSAIMPNQNGRNLLINDIKQLTSHPHARPNLFTPQGGYFRGNGVLSPISLQFNHSKLQPMGSTQAHFQNQNHLFPQIGGHKKKARRPQLVSKFMELTASAMPFNHRKVSTASTQHLSGIAGQCAQSVLPQQSQQNYVASRQLQASQSVRSMPQLIHPQTEHNSSQAVNGSTNAQPPSVMNPLKFQMSSQQLSTRDLQSVLSRGSVGKRSDQTKEAADNFQKFVVNQQSQFYSQQQVMNSGPSIQQTYQMFMPNKIKRGKDLKQNHNILKRTAMINQQSQDKIGNSSSVPSSVQSKLKMQTQKQELQQVIRSITPASVQLAEKQIKQFQLQRELASESTVQEDENLGQVLHTAGTQMTASSPVKLSAQERQIFNFDTMTLNGGGAPSDSSPQKLDAHYAQLSISQHNHTNIQIERVIMQTEPEVFIDDYKKKLGGAIQIKSLGGGHTNIRQKSTLDMYSSCEGSPEQAWKQQLLITSNSTPFKESNQTIDQQIQYSTRYTHSSRKSAKEGKDTQLQVVSQAPIQLAKEQSAPQLFVGKSSLLKPKTQARQPTSNDQKQIITSPYGDASLSNMVYLGGFLLKPRSKMATFQEIKSRQQLKQTQDDETLSNFKEGKESEAGEKLIQVKSLEKSIKLRQQFQKEREMTRSGSRQRQQRLREYQWPPANHKLNSDLHEVDGKGEQEILANGEIRRVGSAGVFTKKRGSNQSQAHNDSLYKHLHHNFGSDSKPQLEIHHSGHSNTKPRSPNSHYLHDLESPHSYRPVQKVLITHKESTTQIDEGQLNSAAQNSLAQSQILINASLKANEQDRQGGDQATGVICISGLNVTGKRSVAFNNQAKGDVLNLGSRNFNKLPNDSKKEVRSYDNTTATKTSSQQKQVYKMGKLHRLQTQNEMQQSIEGVSGRGLGILKNFQHILNKDLANLQSSKIEMGGEKSNDLQEKSNQDIIESERDHSEIEEPDESQSFQAPKWNESPMLSTRTIKMMKAIHDQKQELQGKGRLTNNQKEFYQLFSQDGVGRTLSNSSLLKYHSITLNVEPSNLEGGSATSASQANPTTMVVMQPLYFKEKSSASGSQVATNNNGGTASSNNLNQNSKRLTSKMSKPIQEGEDTLQNKNAEQLTGW